MLRLVLCRQCVSITSFGTVGRGVNSLNRTMANFKFSYVRSFEPDDRITPDQWIVISLENKVPNFKNQVMGSRKRRLEFTELMNKSTTDTLDIFKEVKFAYVHSVCAHFAIDGKTVVWQRRSSKLVSHLASCLTSCCILNWSNYLSFRMQEIPCFEGTVHVFPNDQHLRDYITLNQTNYHLENLRFTLIEAINGDHPKSKPALDDVNESDSFTSENLGPLLDKPASDHIADSSQIEGGADAAKNTNGEIEPPEEEKNQTDLGSETTQNRPSTVTKKPQNFETETWLACAASGSEAYCNEELYSRFRINYNNEPDILKKGTFFSRRKPTLKSPKKDSGSLNPYYVDLRKTAFWDSLTLLSEETKFNAKFFMIPKFQRVFTLVPHAWVVVRLDGKGFHKLAQAHRFKKPNDIRAIELMNISAATLMSVMPDVVLAYGESDEYSFVFHRYGPRYKRNPEALISQCVSIFTAAYVKNWPICFKGKKQTRGDFSTGKGSSNVENTSIEPPVKQEEPQVSDLGSACDDEEVPLKMVPVFDGRAVVYPTSSCLRDYLSWRQADCHINNMYNTAFWSLVQKEGYSRADAEKKLSGTFSEDKRRILMDMGIDYDKEPSIHRKGSVIFRGRGYRTSKTRPFKNDFKQVRNVAWWSEECQAIKETRTSLRKKYNSTYSEADLVQLLRADIEASRVFQKAKSKYRVEKNLNSQDSAYSSSLHESSSSSGKDDGYGEASLEKKSVLEPSATNAEESNKSTENLQPSFEDETYKFRDCEVVIPDDFVEKFEKLYEIDELAPEKKKCILDTFQMKEKPWWTLACHVAKVVRWDATTAYKRNPSEETERVYHLACIRFKAIVQQAKTWYKRNGSGKSNKSSLCLEKDQVPKIDEIPNSTSEEVQSGDFHEELKESADADSNSNAPLVSVTPKSVNQVKFDRKIPDNMNYTENGKDDNSDTDKNNSEIPKNNGTLPPTKPSEGNPQEAPLFAVDKHKCVIASIDSSLVLCYDDIIGDRFWQKYPHILGTEKSALEFEENL